MHIALATYDFLHPGLPASSTSSPTGSTTVAAPTSTTTTSSHSPQTETLVQLCRLWPHLHNPVPDPPPFCHDLLPSDSWQPSLPEIRDRYSTHLGMSKLGEQMVGLDLESSSSSSSYQYTGRSLSLISVLGGILVILVIIAFISCYKHRKRMANGENFSVDLLTSHLRGLHNLSSAQQLQLLGRQPDVCPGPPPDYDTVIKQREEEETGLPTYSVAVERRNTIELKSGYWQEEDDDDDCIAADDGDNSSQTMRSLSQAGDEVTVTLDCEAVSRTEATDDSTSGKKGPTTK